jgi:A nuclease family of the HNH/ENDO VII superfamily with conserved AHH
MSDYETEQKTSPVGARQVDGARPRTQQNEAEIVRRPEYLMALQRTHGNLYVRSMIEASPAHRSTLQRAGATAPPPGQAGHPGLPAFSPAQRGKLTRILDTLENYQLEWERVGFASEQALKDHFARYPGQNDRALEALRQLVNKAADRKEAAASEESRQHKPYVIDSDEPSPLTDSPTPHQDVDTASGRPSKDLENNMRPLFGDKPADHQAHHIVPANYVRGRMARALLGLCGIDVNDGVNGCIPSRDSQEGQNTAAA